jgi:cytochrome c
MEERSSVIARKPGRKSNTMSAKQNTETFPSRRLSRMVLTCLCVTNFSALAFADGDAVKGENVFKKCMACHTATGKTNKTGPYLLGIVGRSVASVEGYNYSGAMKTYSEQTKTWSEDALRAYLANPKAVVPGTRMSFSGVKKPEEISDLIAYLKSKN